MTKPLAAAACASALLLYGPGAQAAMIVHDPTSYAKLIAQAQTALNQLDQLKSQVQQGRDLFDSLNKGSVVSAIAPQLGLPSLRDVVPGFQAFSAAAKGDLKALGAIGVRADEIRASARLYSAPPGDRAGADLEAAGDRIARDLAVGEAVASAGAERLEGLKALQRAIDVAPNARAVLDLQARAQTEQAMIANDQMRLQALAMAQAAEDRLETQRARERMTSSRQARMALYRSGFQ